MKGWKQISIFLTPKSKTKVQAGFSLLELSLVLLVMSALAMAAMEMAKTDATVSQVSLQADNIENVRQAAHKLVMNNYADYQQGVPITEGGVTLGFGTAAGQSLRPTLANLRAMRLGVDDALENGIYEQLTLANYYIEISRSAACSTTPDDPACRVTGLVCLDQPVKKLAGSSGETETLAQGTLLNRLGGVAGISLVGSRSDEIVFVDGATTVTNPFGSVPGIICARFGWGTEGDGYLRVQDTRNPQFQNDVSVGGYLQIDGVATIGGTCSNEGYIGRTADGVFLICQGGVWLNIAGLDRVVTEGSFCVTGQVGQTSAGILMSCQGGVYKNAAGLASNSIAAGSTCAREGIFGMDTNGVSYLCKGSNWLALSSLTPNLVSMSQSLVSDGTVIAKPACATGGSADITLIPSSVSLDLTSIPPYSGLTYAATDLGSSWQIAITLSNPSGGTRSGSTLSVSGIATTYCSY